MQKKKLAELRKRIDLVDNKLLDLIIQRSSTVDKIGKLKKNSKTVVDNKREKEIISRLLNLHKGNFAKDSIVRIWREIFYSSVNIQLRKKNILHPKRGVDSIKLYKGGVSKISGIKKIIKLSSNESPFGPSRKAIHAYKNASNKLSRYPELTAESLQEKIAKKFNLKSDQIICGTGSDEILIFTVLTFCSSGDEVIHAQHGFEMYPVITKYAGATSVLASEDDYKVSIKSILDNITQSTKVILIANPNNPTSTYLNNKELRKLMNKIPKNIVVVIDAAYAEFADASDYDRSFSLANEFKNVIITRTFSKAYSLAGMRLGWGYGSKKIVNMIKKLRPPFNLPPSSIAGGIAALNDDKHLRRVVSHNSKIKNWFINEINKLGFIAYKTQANFVFVIIKNNKFQNAQKINNYLLNNGIAVRYLLSYGIKNALRITLGTKKELMQTLKILKKFVKKND